MIARVFICLRDEGRGVGDAGVDGAIGGLLARVFICLRDEGLGGTTDASGYEAIVVGLALGLKFIGRVGRVGQTCRESARIVSFAR